ncbi:MAG TPA: hypothetical protein V6C95_23690 [Coleofasciculaceae cyanobacterium]
MTNSFEHNSDLSKDVRVGLTAKIWGMATGMLAICIPLSAATRSGPIIPIAVISGATVGTVAIWRSSDKKSPEKVLSSNQLELLEERIANLETIVGHEDLDLRLRLKSMESSDGKS